MDIYLAPAKDEQFTHDLARMNGRVIGCFVLSMGKGPSVQHVVHRLTTPGEHRLVVPDDFHRHTELIEHVKACAYHVGAEVMPLTRYLERTAPPASAPVHAMPEDAGVGERISSSPTT